MQEIDGKWTIFGCEPDDPKCLHTVDEAIEYINEVGFLPFFSGDIAGFSLEDRTVSEDWWGADELKDPWAWREIIARSGNIVYGKFFYNRAGFITKEWFPFFANYRRDGYDFDALWDDEKASLRSKKVMDILTEENVDAEIFSNELKQKAGFGKDGEKGFDSIVTNLQMQTYLCIRDFRQRKNKKGEFYGWPIAIYCTPEHLFGRDIVSKAYTETATESGKRIAKHIIELFPEATPQQVKRLLGSVVGEPTEKIKKEKKTEYPANLLKAINLDIIQMNDDQMIGLEYVLGTLKSEARALIEYRFEKGETYTDIGKIMGFSGATASKRCKKALKHLGKPELSVWIKEGFNGHSIQNIESIAKLKERFIDAGKLKEATFLDKTPDVLTGISKSHANLFYRAGFPFLGNVIEAVEGDALWFHRVSGIGFETAKKILIVLAKDNFISWDCEAYKLLKDRSLYFAECRKRCEAENT